MEIGLSNSNKNVKIGFELPSISCVINLSSKLREKLSSNFHEVINFSLKVGDTPNYK